MCILNAYVCRCCVQGLASRVRDNVQEVGLTWMPGCADCRLHMQSGMGVWHQESNPEGKVVELHGNARYLLCPHCERVTEAKPKDLMPMKRNRPLACSACKQGYLRFKIMLYDDEEASLITPEDVWTRLEDDLAVADLVVWVGISFEQVCVLVTRVKLVSHVHSHHTGT